MLIGKKSFKPNIPIKPLYAILAGMGLLLISFIVFSPYIPYTISVKEGDVATSTIVSPKFLEFESSLDKTKTEELRDQRKATVEKVYSVDENINKKIKSNIVNTFTEIRNYTASTKATPPPPFPESLTFLPAETQTFVKTLNDKEIATLEYLTLQNAQQILQLKLKKIDPKILQSTLNENVKLLSLSPNQIKFIYAILMQHTEPNYFYDEAKTNDFIERAIKSIQPFKTQIKQGEPIIYEKEVVTKDHIEVLKALNIYGNKTNAIKFIGILTVSFFLFLLLDRFIYYFSFRIYNHKKYFILTYCVILLIVLLARTIKEITFLPGVFQVEYLIPIPIAAMMLSILVTPNISLLCGTIISILVAISFKADFHVFYYLFFSTCAATFATYKKHKRTELIVSGYVIGLANVIFIASIGIFQEIDNLLWFPANMVLGFITGVFSSMVTLAILPYFESIFKITTHQTLLELSNLNHPLLKQLMVTAPGTYQHSLMVGNLAETAAEEIKADALLSRVGAYYHDIGKMKRPAFFTENQFSGENPHNTLTPRMSKMIIASHPKDGVDLANKHKLPEIIKKFMMEHHGTTLVSFFYSQAIQRESKEDEPSEEEFRYPGPKPSFKESGIVMLADSVEAAVRSMKQPTPAKIDNLVNKIFKDKIEDHQLDECPISLQEINIIRDTFLRVLKGIYHTRLDYQEELYNILDSKKAKNGKSTQAPESEKPAQAPEQPEPTPDDPKPAA